MHMGKIKIDKFKIFVIYFYANEGNRPHVHISRKGRKDVVQFWLDDLTVKKSFVNDERLINTLKKVVDLKKEKYFDEWRKHHGK